MTDGIRILYVIDILHILCIHMHTHIHTNTLTCAWPHMHTRTHIHANTHIHVYHTCIHAHTHTTGWQQSVLWGIDTLESLSQAGFDYRKKSRETEKPPPSLTNTRESWAGEDRQEEPSIYRSIGRQLPKQRVVASASVPTDCPVLTAGVNVGGSSRAEPEITAHSLELDLER